MRTGRRLPSLSTKSSTVGGRTRQTKNGGCPSTSRRPSLCRSPSTPFQWEKQTSPEEYLRRVHLLQSCLTARGVDYRYHESDLSRLEAVLARGDRRLSKVLLRAHELGCKLDGWDEYFRYDLWMQAFSDCGSTGILHDARLCGGRNPSVADDRYWREQRLFPARAGACVQSVTPDCRTKWRRMRRAELERKRGVR